MRCRAPLVARFDPMVAARRYADAIVRVEPRESTRIQLLLSTAPRPLGRSGSAARALHRALRPAPRKRADGRPRLLHRLGIRAGRRSAARPGLRDGVLPARVPHGALLLEAVGSRRARRRRRTMLVELTQVFNLLTYLWYRARRVARTVPATDLQLESTRTAPRCLCWRPTRTSAHLRREFARQFVVEEWRRCR